MAVEIKPVTIPTARGKMVNGKLNACQVTSVYFPGVGHLSVYPTAADAWNAMSVICAHETGLSLSCTGAYRTYQQQVMLFDGVTYPDVGRYLPQYSSSLTTTRYKVWNGERWYLKHNKASAAVPGTSNHGLAIAIDTAWHLPSSGIVGITSIKRGWDWLVDNAISFGWSWEGALPGQTGWEPWHLRFWMGDNKPQRVIDVENFFEGLK